MRILLDTHVLIWFYATNPKMTAAALSLISDPANEKYISPASYWEVAIKLGTGKYAITDSFPVFVQKAIFDNGFSILPIEPVHCERLIGLPRYHGDPFDRLLIAQALTELMPILSADSAFDAYPLARLW